MNARLARPGHLRTAALLGALLGATAVPASAQPESPHDACFAAARSGSANPFPCDLAAEAGRSEGSDARLAAALANRALIFTAAGRLQAALDDLNSALNLAPDDAALHGNLGNLLLRLGRAADALAAHDTAVRLRPDAALHQYNRAFSYRAVGDADRAAQVVEALSVPEPADIRGPAEAPDR
jgi:predicted Zn-dependent protease